MKSVDGSINVSYNKSELLDDSYLNKRENHKNNIIKSSMILIKATLGLGLMGVPFFFNQFNVIWSIACIVFVGINSYGISYFIAKFGLKIKNDFPDLSLENFENIYLKFSDWPFLNDSLYYSTKIIFFTANIFSSISNFMICKDFFQNKLNQIIPEMISSISVSVSLLMILMVSFLKIEIMEKIRYLSIFGFGIVVFCLIFFLLNNFQGKSATHSEEKEIISWSSFEYISFLIFSFDSFTYYFPVRSAMQNPSKFNSVNNNYRC